MPHPDDGLDAQFGAIVEGLRTDVRALRQRIERFAETYRSQAEGRNGDPLEAEALQHSYRRLKQLQLVANHIESSAAYLAGSGVEPAERRSGRSTGAAEMQVAKRVLDSLEAERERLYREVHDGPAQVLANAIFEVEYLERIVQRAAPELRGPLTIELASLSKQFRSSLELVRGMIYDLRPPILSELGLAEALRNVAREYEERYGLRVDCHLDTDETGLGPAHELAVYRILQEALQNVHKHANAATVGVNWRRTGEAWALICHDDGAGFDLVKAARSTRSVGLMSMRERAELIGGQLQVQSSPGHGTVVTLLLPLPQEDA